MLLLTLGVHAQYGYYIPLRYSYIANSHSTIPAVIEVRTDGMDLYHKPSNKYSLYTVQTVANGLKLLVN